MGEFDSTTIIPLEARSRSSGPVADVATIGRSTDSGTILMGIFAWRNLLTRPLRTVLALVGLSIPILGVLGLFCLSNGLRNLVGDTSVASRG